MAHKVLPASKEVRVRRVMMAHKVILVSKDHRELKGH